MITKGQWRAKVRAALEAYFQRRSYPRSILTLLILLTGAVGFLLSYGMLRAGIDYMSIRYPIAVIASYGFLLGMIRLWVELERSRFVPDDADVQRALAGGETEELQASRARGSWTDLIDLPDVFDFDEGGCVMALVVAAVAGFLIAVIVTIAGAPLLLAEVFIDAFLVVVLARRFRIAEQEHWLSTAIRKTWVSAFAAAAALALGGLLLEAYAPGAKSIGPAIEQIRTRDALPPLER